MTRAALWTGLGEAVEAVQAAVDEYERAPTPQRRAVRDAAFREYVRRLPHVIGNAEANRYEASWVALEAALDRARAHDAKGGG